MIKVFDPRANSVVMQCKHHDLPEKCSSVVWCGEDYLISGGFGKGSQRQIKVYDVRKQSCTATHNLDIANGSLTLNYDDTGVLFVAGKGDSSVTLLEITPEDDKAIHSLTAFRTAHPQVGVCFLPKQCANVKDVELRRMLKLHWDKVEPIRMLCPRNRKEYFQDDIYRPVKSISKPAMTAPQWIKGDNSAPVMEDLCPQGMELLSKAPEMKKASKPSSAYFLAQAQSSDSPNAKDQIKDSLFMKVRSRMTDEPTPDEVGGGTGIDGDEVGDDEW